MTVDGELRQRLREEVSAIMMLREEVAELSARVANLEGRHPGGGAGFAYRQHLEVRRRRVAELRTAGLSFAMISDALGLPIATVQRDLKAVPASPPAYITGRDGKRHPTSNRRSNGARPEA